MKLKYDINAFVMIEEMLGDSLTNIASNPASFMKMTTLRVMCWAGMIHEKPNLSLKEAGEVMQAELVAGKTFADLGDEVAAAFDKSGVFPKMQEKAEGEGEQGNPPTNPAPEQ